MSSDLTEEQIGEYKEAFNLFDADGSGSIEADELREVFDALGVMVMDEEIQDMIRQVDVDGSGTIDFGEFCGLMQVIANSQNEDNEKFAEVFHVFDRNGDGLIDKVDLRKILKELGEQISDDDPIDELIKLTDEDGDGQINKAEFVKLMTMEMK